MPEPVLRTQTMNISDVEASLPSLVDAVSTAQTRVLIDLGGVPVAALVSVEELKRLIAFEREQAERFAVIERMREAFADVPPEQIEQNVVDIIRELRDERWQLLEAMRAPFRGVPVEEIEREAAKAIAELRAERRVAREKAAKTALLGHDLPS